MASLVCLVWSGKARSFRVCLSVDILKSCLLRSAVAMWYGSSFSIICEKFLNAKGSVLSLVCLVYMVWSQLVICIWTFSSILGGCGQFGQFGQSCLARLQNVPQCLYLELVSMASKADMVWVKLLIIFYEKNSQFWGFCGQFGLFGQVWEGSVIRYRFVQASWWAGSCGQFGLSGLARLWYSECVWVSTSLEVGICGQIWLYG